MKRVAVAVVLLAMLGVAACASSQPKSPAIPAWAKVAPEQIAEAKKHGTMGTASLAVEVKWPDGRVEGRKAQVTVRMEGGLVREGATDVSGWARFAELPAGSALLEAVAEMPLCGTDGVLLKDGEEAEWFVILSEGVAVAGRVFDAATGKPIMGARVFMAYPRSLARDCYGPRSEPTGKDGRYETWWAPRGPKDSWTDYRLHARAPGYEIRLEQLPEPTPGAHAVELDFHLPRGGTAHGVVRTPSGAPARGAWVAIMPATDWFAREHPWDWDTPSYMRGVGALTGRTAAEGRYVIHGLPFGRAYAATAWAPGFARSLDVERLIPTTEEPRVSADLALRTSPLPEPSK